MLDLNRETAAPRTERTPGRIWRYAPLIFWLAAIFFASTDELSGAKTASVIEPFLRWFFPHISSEHVEIFHLLVRKAAHFTEYAILGWLAVRAFSTSQHPLLHRRWFLASLVLISLCAFTDEYHQSFVPSRTASIYDSLIDISGGVTALVLIAYWKAKRRRRKKPTPKIDSPLSSVEA